MSFAPAHRPTGMAVVDHRKVPARDIAILGGFEHESTLYFRVMPGPSALYAETVGKVYAASLETGANYILGDSILVVPVKLEAHVK